MATIKDVAKLAGVSVATVSRVINGSPKAGSQSVKRVRKAMLELRYQPNASARALAHQDSEMLGLVVADVSDPFFGAMVKATDHVAMAHKKFLLVANGYHDGEREQQMIEQMLRHRCRALVVHAKKLSDEQLGEYFQQLPGMVLINRMVPAYADRCLALDDHYGAWLATSHLLSQGHRRIGFLCSDHVISDAQDRLAGYCAALNDYDIAFDEQLVTYGSPDHTGGEHAMTELMSMYEKFSALICYNDSMAAGALTILYDNNVKVPEQISIVGFDDGLIARYVHPRLTTIRYPLTQMAQKAAQLAIQLADGEQGAKGAGIYKPTLIRRHSVNRYVSEFDTDMPGVIPTMR
ncbi:substrate-binding domain-containing protein [Celerinatantimonas yamalensis]|uniref:Substrate-binding domain-containing protein n=1 Tax=Celerinatantimonas yamalensis TaxID=559956 RepID=A0ABW9G6A5_9GAMM